MSCLRKYFKYKTICEIIYSQITCEVKDITTMNLQELAVFIQKILKLSNKSESCQILREEYRDTCIQEEKRDQGHEHAIRVAKKYTGVC